MSHWQDKVAVVTGGSAGFGWALTQSLAQAGAKVVMADCDQQQLHESLNRLHASGHVAAGFPVDVTNPDQVRSLIEKSVHQFGRLDLLANIVGRSARGNLLDTPAEKFREYLEVNFLSMVHCTQAAASHLIQSRGHLVNMGSLAAKSAARFLGAYPVSKFAVAAYSQQLRYELSPLGVHVLLVCPGPMARRDAGRRYDNEAANLPAAAKQPGGGVKLTGIPPEKLAAKVLRACERRVPELVVPSRARLLFAILQLSPKWGDWLLRTVTHGQA